MTITVVIAKTKIRRIKWEAFHAEIATSGNTGLASSARRDSQVLKSGAAISVAFAERERGARRRGSEFHAAVFVHGETFADLFLQRLSQPDERARHAADISSIYGSSEVHAAEPKHAGERARRLQAAEASAQSLTFVQGDSKPCWIERKEHHRW